MKSLVLASGNTGKLDELGKLFAPLGIQLIPQSEFQVTEVVEDGLTFVENALIKARHASQQTNLPALADDSGLVVDALNGQPGIYSARYAGSGASASDNNEKLLKAMLGTPKARRRAHFYCAMVLVCYPQDPSPLISTGCWRGQILARGQGSGGFGYDPLFMADGLDQTAAELSPELKNRVSHRAQASIDLLQQLSAH